MKKTIFFGLILVSLFLISGCGPSCPSSCNDYNKCTKDDCSEATNFSCIHKAITPCDGNNICEEGEYGASSDCPSCSDYFYQNDKENFLNNLKFTKIEYDYSANKCKSTPKSPDEVISICMEPSSEISKTLCLYDGALAIEEPIICDKIIVTFIGKIKYSKEECITRIALKTKNSDLLKQVKTSHQITELITNFAIKQEDYSICEMIQYLQNNPFWKSHMESCFRIVYSAADAYTTTKCEGVSDTNKNLCLNALQ